MAPLGLRESQWQAAEGPVGNSGLWGFLQERALLLAGGQGQQQTRNMQAAAGDTPLG